MNILVGHIATSSAWSRFIQAQRWQDVVGPIRQFDRVVVSESENNTIPGVRTIVEPRGERNGTFNLSAMRNQIRLAAQRGEYDGFIVLESDFIVLRWPTCFPSTWAVPYAVYTYKDRESFVDLDENYKTLQRVPRDWENIGGRKMMIPVHCVLVNKRIYHHANWDERFVGCGYDDWDFCKSMYSLGFAQEYTDMFLLHRWHKESGAVPRAENRRLLESKWGPID